MTIEKLTPMMEQYMSIKKDHPSEILFFRMGDFYEMFLQDAEIASRELEITLTGRGTKGDGERIPMCGIPYHAAQNYIGKLLSKGYRVAVCDQVENPAEAKGIVRREVTRILTPGTLTDEAFLTQHRNNYLMVLTERDGRFGMCAADISTGECLWGSYGGTSGKLTLYDDLFRLSPTEILCVPPFSSFEEIEGFCQQRLPKSLLSMEHLAIENETLLVQHFSEAEQPASPLVRSAVEGLLAYLHRTIKADLAHLNHIVEYGQKENLILDVMTLRNLEVSENLQDGGRRNTLLAMLDFTETAMGGRFLKSSLESPLKQKSEIANRHEGVRDLLKNPVGREKIQELFSGIYDLERIGTRIELGSASPRDLASLRSSLQSLPELKEILYSFESPILSTIVAGLSGHDEVRELLEQSLADEVPLSVKDGGVIRAGFDAELDEIRMISKDQSQFLLDMEQRERERTGIKALKVSFNKVFGYYIEISKGSAALAPVEYVRKQTLVNAERFITEELKTFENKILGAQEKLNRLETHLFQQIKDAVKKSVAEIMSTARYLALLDMLQSFAEAAARYDNCQPTLRSEAGLYLKESRHPVVERLIKGTSFVPNDAELNHKNQELIILTGPNMAGKSTYMRQIALIVLMAQAGSFVPAKVAEIAPLDRIFTRIGASDDLATGQSTFMVEMNEVAHILQHGTENSLILLDEVGRGTSTFDGMSIARSVAEYIHQKISAFTLFATHYHELTELGDSLPRGANYSVAVQEKGNQVLFLRRIVPGGADRSYGIHVAELAGLPSTVLERARELLIELEDQGLSHRAKQVLNMESLFATDFRQEILRLEPEKLTPMEAMQALYKLYQQAAREEGKK